MVAHALLMRFNVFGVRTWDAGKGGVDGRLLGIRVCVDLHYHCSEQNVLLQAALSACCKV